MVILVGILCILLSFGTTSGGACCQPKTKKSDATIIKKCEDYGLNEQKCAKDIDKDCHFTCFGLPYDVKQSTETITFTDKSPPEPKIKYSVAPESDEPKFKPFDASPNANSFVGISADGGVNEYNVNEAALKKLTDSIQDTPPHFETKEPLKFKEQATYKNVLKELKESFSKAKKRRRTLANESYHNETRRRLAFRDIDIDHKDWSWTKSVGAFAQVKSDGDYMDEPFCSGMLLADQIHVIGDAHCWMRWDRDNKATNIKADGTIGPIFTGPATVRFIIGAKKIPNNAQPPNKKPPGKVFEIDEVIINNHYYAGTGLHARMSDSKWFDGVHAMFHYDFAVVRLKTQVPELDAYGWNIDAEHENYNPVKMSHLPEFCIYGYPGAGKYQMVHDNYVGAPEDQLVGGEYQGRAGFGFVSQRLHFFEGNSLGGQSGSPLMHLNAEGEPSSWGLLLGGATDESKMVLMRFDSAVISTICGYLNVYANGKTGASIVHGTVVFYKRFCEGHNNPMNVVNIHAKQGYDNELKKERGTVTNNFNYYYPLKRETIYANDSLIIIEIALVACIIFVFLGLKICCMGISCILGYWTDKISSKFSKLNI